MPTSPSLPATARRRCSSLSFSLFSSEISSVSRQKSNERGVCVLSEGGCRGEVERNNLLCALFMSNRGRVDKAGKVFMVLICIKESR
ncbi:hypothetical protein Hanom_Chr16g01449481 [Helianthus anomalus]